jgi:hypothetical protein
MKHNIQLILPSLCPQAYRLLSPTTLAKRKRVHALYSQIGSTRHDIFFNQFGLLTPLVTITGTGRQDLLPSGYAVTPSEYNEKSTIFSLPRVFIILHFGLGLRVQTNPLFRKLCLLANHTHFTKALFVTKQPIGASSLSSCPGQTSCSSIFGLVY